MKHIGQRIKKWRELCNYTQEYVASELAISQELYSRIESGSVDLKYQRILKIAEVLDVSVLELLSIDDKIAINKQYNNNNGIGIVMHQETSPKEKDLYEQLIKQQAE